ncbi:MAG: hypothetical protein LRY27_03925, partial [Chitinophagales bacterium]|nr:hypothetical protein [Chitinophagales bacterium]
NDTLNYINTSKYNEVNLKDFTFDFGVQYQTKINKLENEDQDHEKIYLTVGAYGAPAYNLKGKQSIYSSSTYTSILTGEETAIDTATGGSYNNKVQTKVPAYFGLGAVVGNELTWQAGADFHFEDWKNFSSPISNATFGNEFKVKLGGQIMPNYKSKKYGANVNYRLGAQFGKSRIIYNNKALADFGMTFGFGLPLGKVSGNNRSYSRLNLSFELGKRGVLSEQAIKENYYKFTLAYSLSDRWFIKRKFD